MRFLLCFLLSAFSFGTVAEPVTLYWDRSPDDRGTNGMTYTVYVHTNDLPDYASLRYAAAYPVGTNLTATVPAPRTAYFRATATSATGSESDPSNQIALIPPLPPERLRKTNPQLQSQP